MTIYNNTVGQNDVQELGVNCPYVCFVRLSQRLLKGVKGNNEEVDSLTFGLLFYITFLFLALKKLLSGDFVCYFVISSIIPVLSDNQLLVSQQGKENASLHHL